MYYNRARYYDVENGRFNAMDTWEGMNKFTITLNKYLYAGANAVSYIDPSGNEFTVAGLKSSMAIVAKMGLNVGRVVVKVGSRTVALIKTLTTVSKIVGSAIANLGKISGHVGNASRYVYSGLKMATQNLWKFLRSNVVKKWFGKGAK